MELRQLKYFVKAAETLNFSEAAKALYVTQSTLSEYYHTRKLEVARLLIEERKLTISKISQLLNYSSVNAFSNAFKKKYGVSPKAYGKGLNGAGGS